MNYQNVSSLISRRSTSQIHPTYLWLEPTFFPKMKFIVDNKWEDIDPNPNLNDLYKAFNIMFFREKLTGIAVSWDTDLFHRSVICEHSKDKINIKLNFHYLKLQSRRHIVETLLHGMIHAYHFPEEQTVFKTHDEHFCKCIRRINDVCNTNIPLLCEINAYEKCVDYTDLRQWWRCNGPCKRQPPNFGFIYRSWDAPSFTQVNGWKHHYIKCGGHYKKLIYTPLNTDQ